MNLNTQMYNGATVSDWLGTASTAAKVAANILDDVRDGKNTDALDSAKVALEQALDEINAVIATTEL